MPALKKCTINSVNEENIMGFIQEVEKVMVERKEVNRDIDFILDFLTMLNLGLNKILDLMSLRCQRR